MTYETNDVTINYIMYGQEKKDTIVLLHGWGQNIEMMRMLGDPFAETHNVLIIDLPGFGKSQQPTYPWMLRDYINAVENLLKFLKIKNPIMIGHSFGGKLALIYASLYETKKLVLLASPINHNTRGLSLKTKTLKTLKKIPLLSNFADFAKKHIGSTDYKNASKIMREIMVNHVNEDAFDVLKKIKCPTLLIWGTNDTAVDIDVAYLLEKEISNAGLVVYENATHYAYLERKDQTINVLRSFLGSEER